MGQIEYSGRDNLDVMAHAKNYNRYLLNLVLANAHLTDQLIDFGAGNGTFAVPVAKAGFNVTCIETDPLLCASLQAQGMIVVSDLDQIADGSVHFLYSLNVLEHIEDDLAIAQMWYRKLAPGGHLLVFVPAFQALYTSMDREVGHFRRYTKVSLTSLLQSAHFQIDRSAYVDSLGVLATLLYKLFDQGSGKVNLAMLKIYDRWVFPLSRTIDLITHTLGGKNILVRAHKPIA
jgi:SAM-dependent methyltransferase